MPQEQNDTIGGAEGGDIVSRLTAQDKLQIQSEMHNELLKDPDFAALFSAKAAGRKIKVVEDGGIVHPEPQKQEVPQKPIEEMSETERMQFMIKTIGEQLSGTVDKKLQPVQEQLQQFGGYIKQSESERLRQTVESFKQKIGAEEFEAHRQQMFVLSQSHPTLKIDELYVLAATQAGKPVKTNTQVSSERPVFTSTRAQTQKNGQPQGPVTGLQGLRDLLRGGAQRATSGQDMDLSD